MIKIFHVIECGELTGCGKMVAAIANRLDAKSFDVTLVYAVRPGTLPETYADVFKESVRKIYLPQLVRPPSPFKDLAALYRLWALFRREKPGVVHLHSSKAGFLGRLAAFMAGVPKVFYSPYGYSFRMADASPLARKFYYLLEKIASLSGYIVATSPAEKKSALLFAPETRVVEGYNGIDIAAYEPCYPAAASGSLLSIACGRITSAKRPEAFVRLAALAKQKFPQARFVWVGSGSKEEMSGIRAYAEQLGADNVTFTGWVSDAELNRLMRLCDIFVHYSAWDALPLAVTEAMALGKPVLASEAVEQVVSGENGYVAGDEAYLLRFFFLLAASGELRNTMGKEARRSAENKYNINTLAGELASRYSGGGKPA